MTDPERRWTVSLPQGGCLGHPWTGKEKGRGTLQTSPLTTIRDGGGAVNREPVSSVDALAGQWRREANQYERDGVPGHAVLLRRVATELERARRTHELEELTFVHAAAESGYSAAHLRRLFPARQTVPRGSLPRKPTRLPLPHGEPDLAALILRRAG